MWSPHLFQVVQGLPHTVKSSNLSYYLFTLPSRGPLGDSDEEFQHVQIKLWENGDIKDVEDGAVFIATRSHLGQLPLGLLHLADYRERITPEEVAQRNVDMVQEQLRKKRTACLKCD